MLCYDKNLTTIIQALNYNTKKMSEEESNHGKRSITEGSDNDEAIGPCIADAVPAKKQKGMFIGLIYFRFLLILTLLISS